jgi:hypothetical protein
MLELEQEFSTLIDGQECNFDAVIDLIGKMKQIEEDSGE